MEGRRRSERLKQLMAANQKPKLTDQTATKRRRKITTDSDNGRDWSAIPGDIVCLVAEKINFIEDYVRFCAVCRNWYLFATEHYSLKKKFELPPFLMLQEDPNSPTTKRAFESYVSGGIFTVDLPEAAGRRCWGSPYGWIVTYGSDDLEFSLLNPFSGATINLPSLRTLIPTVSGEYSPYRNFIKPILTASPDSPDCLVILITSPSEIEAVSGYGKRVPSRNESVLGFVRPNCKCSNVWSRIEGIGDLSDVVCFKGKLYGCRGSSLELVLIDLDAQPPRAVEFAALPLVPRDRSLGCHRVAKGGLDVLIDTLPEFSTTKYLVDVGGELCLVLRYTTANKTMHFKIFTIDIDTKKWTRRFPLGENRSLFVGSNSTFIYQTPPAIAAVTADHFKSDFVYYTQDDDLTPYTLDQGFANMFNRRASRYEEESIINPSLWVTPYLRFSPLEDIDQAL